MSTPTIPVLQTPYAGILFRSRLEARWAMFMDLIRVRWQYEPEGYQLDCGKYLPDFFLPELDCFLEIKPGEPDKTEASKASQLAVLTGKNVYLMRGTPEVPSYESWGTSDGAILFCSFKDETGELMPGEDYHYIWCECPHCLRCEIQFDGRSDRIHCNCPKSAHGDKGYNFDSDRLKKAYSIARSYRFGT